MILAVHRGFAHSLPILGSHFVTCDAHRMMHIPVARVNIDICLFSCLRHQRYPANFSALLALIITPHGNGIMACHMIQALVPHFLSHTYAAQLIS